MRPDRYLLKLRWLFVFSLLASPCAMAVTSTDYAYRFALDTHGDSAAWRVELTPAVYAASKRDAELRDIVVVNAQGREVPFADLPPASPQAHPYALTARLLPLPAESVNQANGMRVQRNANGDIVIEPSPNGEQGKPTQWLLDAKRAVSLDSIEFDPSAFAQDLRIHLAVDASNDLQQWENRSDDTEIVSVKRGEDAVEQNKISISGEPARYYRLRLTSGDAPWDSAQTTTVKLSGNYVDPVGDRAASRQWQTLPVLAVKPGVNGGTDYDYRLPAALPVEVASITLANTNTAARFTLLNHDDAANDVALATIVAVQTDKSKDAPFSTFDAVRVQHLRLHTDTPLPQPPRLAVGWHADEFVFLAEGAGPYSLLAGSYAARRGNYPVTDALEKLRPADAGNDWQPPLAAIGARSDVGGTAALLPPKVPYDWSKPLLWLVLIGGALLVIGMALSLLRGRSSSSNDPR